MALGNRFPKSANALVRKTEREHDPPTPAMRAAMDGFCCGIEDPLL
jgi:hypothetical protein